MLLVNATLAGYRIKWSTTYFTDSTTDGTAEFAGDVQVGGDPAGGANAGCDVRANGSLVIAGNSSGDSAITIYDAGNSSGKISLNADGSVEFAGGSCTVASSGRINIDRAEGQQYCFTTGYDGNTEQAHISGNGAIYSSYGLAVGGPGTTQGAGNAVINADGSAEFAGGEVTIFSSGSLRTNGQIYVSDKTTLSSDGSATFAGQVNIGNDIASASGTRIYNNGALYLRSDVSAGNSIFKYYNGGFGDPNVKINFSADGSAQFAGLTEHAGGVKATGQNGQSCFEVPSDVGSTSDIVGYRFANASGTGAYSTGFLHTGVGDGLVQYSTGFQAMENVGRGTVSCIGFQSSLKANGDINYNFYAGGSAPNYFAGATEIVGITKLKGGTSAANTDAYIYAARNSSISPRLMIQRQGATSSTENALEVIASTEAQPIQFALTYNGNFTRSALAGDYRLTDYRIFSPTAIQNASQIVSQLSPKLEGFIAHELQSYVPEAVIGTQDAEEAIGTLADYNGTVLETEVTEPSAEELTYTEEVETEGVTTQAIRTRTWTATGTRPVYQGVDQTKLIPLITKALQEVMQKNEDLEARIAALEG